MDIEEFTAGLPHLDAEFPLSAEPPPLTLGRGVKDFNDWFSSLFLALVSCPILTVPCLDEHAEVGFVVLNNGFFFTEDRSFTGSQ